MQIRLRPSGGRGEYELAGSHGPIRGSDIYGLELWFDFGLELRVPLHAIADTHDGKPRIRLDDTHLHVHAARLLAAILLLPEPIREIRKTGNGISVDLSRCAYSAIFVEVVTKTGTLAVLRPRTIVAINAAGASVEIDVLNRFQYVESLWNAAALALNALDVELCAHRAACNATPFAQKAVLNASINVVNLGGAPSTESTDRAVVDDREIDRLPPPASDSEDDASNPIQVNRDLRRRLSWRADRGADGRRFKQLVNSAYDFRCAFRGIRLPPLTQGYLPGVDAAHIYPWSRFGSNDVTNGICLSKDMHWAFDEGILKLTFDPHASTYLLELGDSVSTLSAAAGFEVNHFANVCGPIPDGHLPIEPALRPSRKAIDLYNALMFPQL